MASYPHFHLSTALVPMTENGVRFRTNIIATLNSNIKLERCGSGYKMSNDHDNNSDSRLRKPTMPPISKSLLDDAAERLTKMLVEHFEKMSQPECGERFVSDAVKMVCRSADSIFGDVVSGKDKPFECWINAYIFDGENKVSSSSVCYEDGGRVALTFNKVP